MNAQDARSFRIYGFFTIAYTVAVIVFGAWVRVTGSGAGCGQSWPTCNGSAVPFAPSVETMIEFTHRMTSGLALVLVVILVLYARRVFPENHPSRKWAMASVVFMVTEALIGAGLVLFGLVENDDSAARAAVISVHLVNTFLLLATICVTVFFGRIEGIRSAFSKRGARVKVVAVCGVAFLIVSMTGAVTALGDTLYPIDPTTGARLIERIALDQHPTAHFLVRMRAIHPVLAIAVAIGITVTTAGISQRVENYYVRQWGRATAGLLMLQLLVGALNIALKAPGWMQLLHLFVSNLIWIAFVFFAAHLLEGPRYTKEMMKERKVSWKNSTDQRSPR